MAQSSPQPNPQLEAALVQFGQSGATPVQEAQLRAALAADAKLMRDYNQAAQAGQVQSFALPAAGSGPNIVGHYDIAGGVVTLPASAFQPSGNTPSADLRGSLQVQEMMARFGHSSYQLPGATPGAAATTHPMTQHMLDNFQNTVNQSPVAAADMMRAATTRDPNATPRAMLLENFGFVGPGMSAGGTYNPSTNTLNLPPLNLQTPTPGGPGRFSADDMTFVIGHEVDHSFNSVAKAQALSTFSQSVRQIAGSAAVVHDYTAPATNYIEAARRDEASAEIAGWNALVSRQQQLNPNTSLSTIVALTTTSRQADFISLDPATGSVAIRPGLTFNPDATLPDTPANVAAMGQHYFNRPDPANAQPGQRPVTLGESGRSDYPNYYGTFVVEEIIQAERQHAAQHPGVTHKLTLNMSAIGLRETLMEQEGINIRTNPATPQTYYDSSQTPPVQSTFHHTQDGTVNPAHNHTHVPVVPSLGGGQSRAPGTDQDVPAVEPPRQSPAQQLSSTDQALHQRILDAARAGGYDDERSANIAAQGVVAFKQDRVVRQADDVGIYGGNLYITSFPFGRGVDPNFHTPPLDVEAASKVPAQHSVNQALEIDQRQKAQQQTQNQPTQTPEVGGQSGPTIGARSL